MDKTRAYDGVLGRGGLCKTRAFDGLCWEGYHEFKKCNFVPAIGVPMEYCKYCGLLRLVLKEDK